MIKKIRANNIRNLKDFDSWELLQYNLIYASNWSWKSNITKILSHYSVNSYIDNLNNLKSLEAKGAWENISSGIEKNQNDKIYVYDEEFTKRCINIDWDFSSKEHKWNIILSKVWADNVEVDRLEKEKSEIEKKWNSLRQELEKKLNEKINDCYKKYWWKNTTYQDELKIDNLEHEKINIIGIKLDAHENFKNIEKIDENSSVNNFFLEIEKIELEEIKTILFWEYDFENESDEIEKYINEQVSKNWIEQWLKFHNDWDDCPFCQQKIENKKIIEQYKWFIESKKSKFLNKIDEQIEKIENIEKNIDKNLEKINNWLKDKIIELKNVLWLNNNFNDLIEKIENLDSLINYLKEKKRDLQLNVTIKDNIFVLKLENIKTSIESYNNTIKSNNELIRNINSKIKDTWNRKTELRKEIAKNELINFFNNNQKELEERIKLSEEYKFIEQKIVLEKEKLPRTDKKEAIIKILNQLLNVLYLKKYEIDNDFNLILIWWQDKYPISENTELISNWEKNVISFCYYVASIIQYIDKIEDLETLTLVIDDPVESTSYNYLHWISVIISKIGEIINRAYEKEVNIISPQFIILTHNLNFYNWFLWNNVWNKFSGDKWKVFHLKNSNWFCIWLTEVNKKKILSEFDTSLKIIIEYKKSPTWDNIWIHIRRVLESLCYFYNLDYSWDSIWKILCKDSTINNIIQFISHDYTHLNPQKIIDWFPTDNLVNVVIEIYDWLNKNMFSEKIKSLENL